MKSRRRIDQQALRFEAVAARASRFLLIVLERSRRARMNDEPHVGSVDAHPEGDRGDDDIGTLVEERILVPSCVRHRRARRDRAGP